MSLGGWFSGCSSKTARSKYYKQGVVVDYHSLLATMGAPQARPTVPSATK